MPNIEAYARIELIQSSDDSVAACLQATLSNGWTTQQNGVKYATGMFTLAAAVIGLIHSVFLKATSPAIYRWFDILYLFQTAAAGGMMHLNYPLAFSNFVQNFAWAMGLFHSTAMQHSITKMRNKTGGKMSGDAYSQIQYINRKLSPYNVRALAQRVDITEQISTSLKFAEYIRQLPRLQLAQPAVPAVQKSIQLVQIPSYYDQTNSNKVETGVAVYTGDRGIAVANAFDTAFFVFLAFLAIMVAFHAVLGGVVWFLCRQRKEGKEGRVAHWAKRMRNSWWDFCAANALRTCLIFFTPFFILGFYQWIIGKKDSGLSVFFSILGMAMVFAPLVAVLILSMVKARRTRGMQDVWPLYTDLRFYRSVGDALYRQYRQQYHFFWFAPMVVGMIVRSAFISFGYRNAWAQVIGCLLVEFIIFCCQLVLDPYRPRHEKRSRFTCRIPRFRLPALLTLFRMIYFGLCIAFVDKLGVKAIPRTAIGIVQIAIIGIPTVILLVATIYNAGYGLFWRKDINMVEDGALLEQDDDTSTTSEKTGKDVSRTVSAQTDDIEAHPSSSRTEFFDAQSGEGAQNAVGSAAPPNANQAPNPLTNAEPPNPSTAAPAPLAPTSGAASAEPSEVQVAQVAPVAPVSQVAQHPPNPILTTAST